MGIDEPSEGLEFFDGEKMVCQEMFKKCSRLVLNVLGVARSNSLPQGLFHF